MSTTASTRRGPQGGPPLLAPGLAYGVLMIGSVVLSATTPQLSASAASVLAYDQTHHLALTVAGFLGFAASAPLAIWAATAYRRLRTLGVTAPGAVIGLSGGILAAMSLALTGLLGWTSGQLGGSADASAPVARALADLGFATGSAGFVVPLALLVAGIAVPSLLLGFGPKPLAWIGLGVAAVGLVSTFTLLTPALDFTLPIGRFGSLLWLIAVSVTLPRNRHEVVARPARDTSAAVSTSD